MSLKDLKPSNDPKPDIREVKEVKTRKKEKDKLKHTSSVRFTDTELVELDRIGLVYNGKIDTKRLRMFINAIAKDFEGDRDDMLTKDDLIDKQRMEIEHLNSWISHLDNLREEDDRTITYLRKKTKSK